MKILEFFKIIIKIPYDDFIYAYYIRSLHAFEDINSKKNETHLYIPVGLMIF